MVAQVNQSVIDGIVCLQELASSKSPVGPKELAARLGINETKVIRLLGTLKLMGMVEQNSQRKYTCGPGVQLLAAQSYHSSPLFRAAVKVAMHNNYNDRILAVGLLWRNSVVYMYHAMPEQEPAEGIGGYHLVDVADSCIGQALLAVSSDDNIQEQIQSFDDVQQEKFLAQVPGVRENGVLVHRGKEGQVSNMCALVNVQGLTAGIAFAALDISESEVESYLAELKGLVADIVEASSQVEA
ncbi:helix-turn-helix domain-containing protein [Vibrio sp. WXL103]|uniref:helix-turn-helix domain-containing protein n=1 Tax=unclassified Vibrio TaxID=2614977 RepID=UPI003EC4E8E6